MRQSLRKNRNTLPEIEKINMDANHITDFDNLPEESKKEVLNKLLFEKIKTETKQRLETDKVLQEYFSQFNKISVDIYWNFYATKKALWMTSPSSLETSADYIDLKYAKEAKNALALILKRKAMQQIAEWNAYEKNFEGIEVSVDFALWDADIFNVHHIEPIERQEVDIYLKYLKRADEDELERIFLPTSYFIQRHAAGLNNDDESDNDFSSLYNTLKGAGTYLILPPKKTDIEKMYENALRDHRMKEQEKDIESGKKQKYIQDKRPYAPLNSNHDIYEFVKRFEDAEVMRCYRTYARFHEDDVKENLQQEDEENLEWHIKLMLRENEPISVEAHEDFREALKDSFKEFEIRKTIAAIETTYEDYLFRIKNKMSFERNEEKIAQAKDWIMRTKEHLIEARVFAGKPADLNMF